MFEKLYLYEHHFLINKKQLYDNSLDVINNWLLSNQNMRRMASILSMFCLKIKR